MFVQLDWSIQIQIHAVWRTGLLAEGRKTHAHTGKVRERGGGEEKPGETNNHLLDAGTGVKQKQSLPASKKAIKDVRKTRTGTYAGLNDRRLS